MTDKTIPVWAHILVLCAIAAAVLYAAVNLAKWNRGRKVDLSDVDGSAFDVEVNDNVFLLSAEDLAGKKDDGKNTILFLGNDLLKDIDSGNGIVSRIGKSLSADTVNASFTGTTVALKNRQFDAEYPQDAFSFTNIAHAIAEQDFSLQEEYAGEAGGKTCKKKLKRLEKVDYDALDMIIIAYDASDYLNQRIGMDPEDEENEITYRGAMVSGVRAIRKKYPYVRIVVLSFPLCYAFDSSGQIYSGYMLNYGHGRITDYWQHLCDACEICGVTFVDDLYGTISEENSSDYLQDHIHINSRCAEKIAEHAVSILNE